MSTEKRQWDQKQTKPETQRLLTAASYFLQCRNFADCCKYAAQARDSDPTHPEPIRILSLASVLSVSKISSTLHDYYAVLNLPYFDSDAARIGSRFKTLASILAPNVNPPCPLSSEAFDLVLTAWSVLSNPVEKAKFDDELRMKLTGGWPPGNGGGTFWTMCPYCYYVYEYEKVFEDCCLRCANERCRRVLHAVAIRAPPPPGVVEKGQYWCPGFMPFAITNINGEGTREKLWNPFAPAIGPASEGSDHNVAGNGDCFVISDDETVEGKEYQNHSNRDENEAVNGEKVENTNGSTEENGVEEVRMQWRKSVPWNSKKLLGRGIRIDSNQAHFIFGVGEEGYSNVDKNEGQHFEPLFGGETFNGIESGVEFFEGDDDIFVSLPVDSDFENGEV